MTTRRGGRGKTEASYERAHGPGSAYLVRRHGSKVWYVRKGKIFKSTGTDNKNLARFKRDEILATLKQGLPLRKARKSFREVYQEFLDFKEPTVEYGTFKNHYVYPYTEIKGVFADMFIDELTAGKWEDFTSDIKRRFPERNLFGYHTLLNSVIQFALKRGYLKEDPKVKLDRKQEHESDVHPFSRDEVNLALTNSEGWLHKMMVMMARRGPRVKETRLMRIDFFNFDEGVINLPGSIKSGERRVIYTKTGKPRTIPMGALKDTFLSWVSESRSVGSEFVFIDPAKPSEPVSQSVLRNTWEEFRDGVGLTGGLYRFRHFSIVQMLMASISPATVAKIHGHDIKTLYRKYSKFLNQDLNEAMKRLEG